jgi:hypothetical protein
MPGKAWGMTARKACFRLNGDICGGCYADKGAYVWANVRNAYDTRFEWAMQCMKTKEGRDEFVRVMTKSIMRLKEPYFRVHDSGDFLSAQYAECWYRIAQNVPDKRFWFPTRVWQRPAAQNAGTMFVVLGQTDPLLAAVRKLATLPNVTVRPSALNVGDAAPVVEGLHAGSSVDYSGAVHNCVAPQQKGECGSCRHCWDNKDVPVDYAKH